jgi:hypothetical protein
MPVLARANGQPRAARAVAPTDNWGDAITKLIPIEVVAGYLAAVQIVTGLESSASVSVAQWILFGVGMVATILYMLATWDPDPAVRRADLVSAWPQLFISLAAFVAWAFAIGAPFGLFAWYESWMGGLALIAGALLLAAINKLLGTWAR